MNDIKNADQPAYGAIAANGDEFLTAHEYDPDTSGLSKREVFAKAAMQGILAGINSNVEKGEWHGWAEKDFAEHAVKNADALLAELEK